MKQTSLFSRFVSPVAAALLLTTLVVSSVVAQDPYDDPVINYSDVPTVTILDNNVSLQSALYQDYYRSHSAAADLRWVQENDSAIVDFWVQHGSLILHLLSRNAGIEWLESEFDFYLLRFFQTEGSGDPLIIPLGGTRQGGLTEAACYGARMQFNIIYQLARRMLAQADRPGNRNQAIASHPLMRPGAYRRDNLAMLLALVTAEQVIGLDSTFDAYQSAYWKNRHPGREVFEEYLLKEWILSPERPLATWIAQEPYSSRLVAATRPPRLTRLSESITRQRVEGLPIKGRLGFSVRIDDRNRLVVDKLDMNRLAFASGLQEGDVIRQVNGARVGTQKQLIELILEALDGIGATLSIQREGQPMTVILRPVEVSPLDEEFFWDDPQDFLYDPPVVGDSLRDTVALPPNQ